MVDGGGLLIRTRKRTVGSNPTRSTNKMEKLMLYGIAGLVLGVFLPVKYNLMIKNAIFAAWAWIKKQTATV